MNARALPMVAVSLLLLTLLLWTGSLAVSEPAQLGAVSPVPVAQQAAPAPTATYRGESLRMPQALHDRSLITGDPCAPPCWRGITPGVTTVGEAYDLLANDPTLSNLHIRTTDAHGATLTFGEQGGQDGMGMLFSWDSETVGFIALVLAPGIALSEVIAAYGEPAYVLGTPFSENPPQASVSLVYPERRMSVDVFVEGETGTLDSSADVVSVLYMDNENLAWLIQGTGLHEWEGLVPFATYGPDAPLEITPVPTWTPPPVPAVPTRTPLPTYPPPPSAEDLDFSTLYLHPTNMFAIGQPAGFDQVAPSQTASLAQVNLVNPNVQAVIDAYVQDPQEPMTTEGLSGFFSQDVLDSTWDYFTSWDETGRETSATDLTIDFVVRYQQQEYIVRQRAWTDGAWIYSVRVLTPSNAREYRNAVLDGAVRSMMGFTQFAGTPMNWVAYYDPASGMVIRYPQSWPVTAGGPGYLTTMSSPDGALLHVETRSTEAVDSRAEAETVLREIDPNAAIKTATNVTKGGTDTSVAVRGWQFTYTTSADGEVQRGIAEVVTGPDGTVYVAALRWPADDSTGSTEYEQIMSTFGVLPPLNLSEGSP